LLLDHFHQPRREWQSADESRTQHHSSENLSYHFGLPQSYEEIAEQLRHPDQYQEDEENRSEIGIRHARLFGACEMPRAW
jgi:hypothetical protein